MRSRALAILVVVSAASVVGCNTGNVTKPDVVVPPPSIRFTATGKVTSGGAPVAGAEVSITFGSVAGSNKVLTDVLGRYSFDSLTGQIAWEIRHLGFYPGFGFASTTFAETNIDVARAQPVLIGESVSGSVGGSLDNFCDENFLVSCQVYTLTASTSGPIQIDVVWSEPVDLDLTLVAPTGDAPTVFGPRGHLTFNYTLTAGQTYDIWVSSKLPCNKFDLTVSALSAAK